MIMNWRRNLQIMESELLALKAYGKRRSKGQCLEKMGVGPLPAPQRTVLRHENRMDAGRPDCRYCLRAIRDCTIWMGD